MAMFQTKYFGYGYYPPRQECEWTLEAPAGATLKLFFSFFDVARGDYFIVRGKDYYWGSIWQSFAVPFEIGPNENSISFTFSSNTDWKRGWGFRFVVVQIASHLITFIALGLMLTFLNSLQPWSLLLHQLQDIYCRTAISILVRRY